MITSINAQNFSNPAFKGIVKVQVLVGDKNSREYKITHDYKQIGSAVKQLKSVLMKQADAKAPNANMDAFRKVYNHYDSDYKIPLCRMQGDTRHIMSKVQTGKHTFIVTGEDAAAFAYSGENIGKKRALEKTSSKAAKYGVEETAREDYKNVKDEVAINYFKRQNHPKLTIYTYKNGDRIILAGARMENDAESFKFKNDEFTRPYILTTQPKKSEKTANQPEVNNTKKKEPAVKPENDTANTPVKKEEKPIQGKFIFSVNLNKGKTNKTMEDISSKSWDSIEKKAKKSKKNPEPIPIQLFLDI